MLYAKADPNPNYYGAYMGGVRSITLNGNGLAQVGLQAGLVVSYTFDQVRAVSCLDAGMDLSQTQNSLVQGCAFEHNGMGMGPLACGLRFSDAASTNRVISCGIGQNWVNQVVFCDPRQQTADGGTSSTNDQPAGMGGPCQNLLLSCMIEEYSGRSKNLLYARAGQGNIVDSCYLSHVGVGPVTLMRMTSEDAPLPYPTANWIIRDSFFSGSGQGYTGLRANGTWRVTVRNANWNGVTTTVARDRFGAVVELA